METDPLGKSPKEPGSKLDAGKPPIVKGIIQYFPRALRAVSMVSLFGANKYDWKGWETVPDGVDRYSDALGRHLIDEATGAALPERDIPLADLLETADPKIVHAAQVAWNALARLELMLRDDGWSQSALLGVEYKKKLDPLRMGGTVREIKVERKPQADF